MSSDFVEGVFGELKIGGSVESGCVEMPLLVRELLADLDVVVEAAGGDDNGEFLVSDVENGRGSVDAEVHDNGTVEF